MNVPLSPWRHLSQRRPPATAGVATRLLMTIPSISVLGLEGAARRDRPVDGRVHHWSLARPSPSGAHARAPVTASVIDGKGPSSVSFVTPSATRNSPGAATASRMMTSPSFGPIMVIRLVCAPLRATALYATPRPRGILARRQLADVSRIALASPAASEDASRTAFRRPQAPPRLTGGVPTRNSRRRASRGSGCGPGLSNGADRPRRPRRESRLRP